VPPEYDEVEVYYHAFLNCTLDGDEWSASDPRSSTHVNVCRGVEREAGWATAPVCTFRVMNYIALGRNRSSNCRMRTNSVYDRNLFIVKQPEKIQHLFIVKQPEKIQHLFIAKQPEKIQHLFIVKQPEKIQHLFIVKQLEKIQHLFIVKQLENIQYLFIVKQQRRYSISLL